jgi:transposase, IS5 family
MPRRRIGQETFGFEARERATALDELHGLIEWAPIEAALSAIPVAERGEAGWPPLALFKALLIAVWHDLSDVKLAEALEDRSSFRRFCGFSRFEPTPERTAFVRFRRLLVALELDGALFERVNEQLRARSVTVKTGTLVDATVVASASQGDDEAGWSGHRARKAIHGYKAHVAADADTGLVERVDVTPGNVHDGRAGGAVVPDDPGLVYADSAYRGARFAQAVQDRGGATRIAPTSYWGREGDVAAAEAFAAEVKAIHRIRSRIEKIFGTWKRSYGLRRMRWRGLAKAALQVRLTAIAYNLRRSASLLRAV